MYKYIRQTSKQDIIGITHNADTLLTLPKGFSSEEAAKANQVALGDRLT